MSTDGPARHGPAQHRPTQRQSAPPRSALLGVDWGSTHLRTYRLGAAGQVLAGTRTDAGILTTPKGRQAEVLRAALDEVGAGDPGVPVVAAGMLGSRAGLVETVPVHTPATAAQIAAGAGRIVLPGAQPCDITVSPGLIDRHAGHDDLIRGEEAQILGWLATAGPGADAVLLLPGTHSKWVRVRSGVILGFRTFPTGELFAACRAMPSLNGTSRPDAGTAVGEPGATPAEPDALPAVQGLQDDPGAFPPGAFRSGAEQARSGGLLHNLFALRATALAYRGPRPYETAEHLSGLLIGAEIAEAAAAGLTAGHGPVVLVSDPPLRERYRFALALQGIRAEHADAEDCVTRGLAALAGRLNPD